MNVVLYQRNFSAVLGSQPLKLTPVRYSFAAMGGPLQATIQAEGDEASLWGLVELLRSPVEIISDNGSCLWWGYISAVNLQMGDIRVGVNLDDMANNIAVAYTITGSDGKSRQTTAWLADTDSEADYGVKEILQTCSGSSADHALAAQAMYLAQKRYPAPTIQWGGGGSGEDSGTITCRGWWSTLNWKYASVPTRLAFEYSNGGANYNLGAGVGKIAQLVTITDTNLFQVSVQLRKVGSPAEDVRVALCSEDGSNPGTELGYGTIAASTIATDYAWCTVTLNAAVAATGRLYIVVSTSQNDVSNCYQVLIGSGYDLGVFHIYQSAWSEVANSDLCFRLYADDYVETSQQARSIATAFGQFITGVDLQVSSGVTCESYRDGDATALYEAEQLLTMGTSNNRRMLAWVDRNRVLRVYEEPTSSNPYFLLRDGSLSTPFDTPLRRENCPVACWARLRDVIPNSVDVSKLIDPTLVFIEENEYDVETDTLTPTPRGMVNPFDLARVKDG